MSTVTFSAGFANGAGTHLTFWLSHLTRLAAVQQVITRGFVRRTHDEDTPKNKSRTPR